METTAEQPGPSSFAIGPALKEARKELSAIGKDGRNTAQNYSFRGIDQVLNSIGPVLAKHNIIPATRIIQMESSTDVFKKDESKSYQQQISRCETILAINLTSMEDGSVIELQGAGAGMDYNGDKHVSKSQSLAFKYALLLGLGIPVEAGELEDGDSDNYTEKPHSELKENGSQRSQKPKESQRSHKPGNKMDPEEIEKQIQQGKENFESKEKDLEANAKEMFDATEEPKVTQEQLDKLALYAECEGFNEEKAVNAVSSGRSKKFKALFAFEAKKLLTQAARKYDLNTKKVKESYSKKATSKG